MSNNHGFKNVSLSVEIDSWPLASPFQITGHRWESVDLVVVRLEREGRVGLGEASGVYYKSETGPSIQQQIESIRKEIEGGVSREGLQELLPAGGARNAVDCAMWDLEAKITGAPVWQLAGVARPKPVLTTFTCGADSPEKMAAVAEGYVGARAVKIKLTGKPEDADRVRAVRAARKDVWLTVDANQGFTREHFDKLMPVLIEAQVELIEQPFPIGKVIRLKDLSSAIRIAADESAQTADDIPGLVGQFDTVNIKLDKCGGLTAGLAMARAARSLGLDTMVGNMIGTSLGMAPACVVGQLCSFGDLDGPIFLRTDRQFSVEYKDGYIASPELVWGYP